MYRPRLQRTCQLDIMKENSQEPVQLNSTHWDFIKKYRLKFYHDFADDKLQKHN